MIEYQWWVYQKLRQSSWQDDWYVYFVKLFSATNSLKLYVVRSRTNVWYLSMLVETVLGMIKETDVYFLFTELFYFMANGEYSLLINEFLFISLFGVQCNYLSSGYYTTSGRIQLLQALKIITLCAYY